MSQPLSTSVPFAATSRTLRAGRVVQDSWSAVLLLCALALWVFVGYWVQFVRPGLLAMHVWPASGGSVLQIEQAYASLRAAAPATSQQTVVYLADAGCACTRRDSADIDAMSLRAAKRGQALLTLAAADFGATMPPGVDLLVFSAAGQLLLASRARSAAMCGSPLLAFERALNMSLNPDPANANSPLYLPEPCACS